MLLTNQHPCGNVEGARIVFQVSLGFALMRVDE